MQKRLNIAKKLLSNVGVLIISIDDFEYANLKLLCDKIFGENYVDTMVWRKSGDGRDGKMKNTTTFRKDHEYLIFCFNQKNKLNKIIEKPNFQNEYTNPDDDPRGPYKAGSISRKESASNPNHEKYYSVTSPGGKIFTRQFDITKKEFDKLNNDILINKEGKSVSRIYWGKNDSAVPAIKIFTEEERTITPYSILLSNGTTTEGTKEVGEILRKDCSKMRPKPTTLIATLIQLASNNNSIILDFFAGTGTVGHATKLINVKYGGNRKYILCTDDVEGICSNYCYPRIKNIINGYKKYSNNESVKGLGGNLKYFKTSLIRKTTNRDQVKIDLTSKCTEMLCVKENIFNLEKKNKDFKIFSNNKKDKFLCIYYNFLENSFDDFLNSIKKLKGEKAIYIFSLEDKVNEKLFKDLENYKVEAIPHKILDIYKQLILLNIKKK